MAKKNTESRIQSAYVKSHQALEVFTNTLKQLTQANDELVAVREEEHHKIQKANHNIANAMSQYDENNAIIDKINSIID